MVRGDASGAGGRGKVNKFALIETQIFGVTFIMATQCTFWQVRDTLSTIGTDHDASRYHLGTRRKHRMM